MVAHDTHLYVFGGAADSNLPNDLYWLVNTSLFSFTCWFIFILNRTSNDICLSTTF